MQQVDVERSQEFRKCIECFLCQTVCHVIRDHDENKQAFSGPRYFIRAAELDMHPLDDRTDRKDYAQTEQGLGFCNITKCCTEVCPEHIKITDNGIIPMKERVVDRRYDPLVWLGSKIFRRGQVPQTSVTSGHSPGAVRSSAASGGVHSHAGGSHDAQAEVQAQQGVNWHREVPHPTAPAVDASGKLPLTELTFDRAAAPPLRRRRHLPAPTRAPQLRPPRPRRTQPLTLEHQHRGPRHPPRPPSRFLPRSIMLIKKFWSPWSAPRTETSWSTRCG
ncbi:hypothetical protein GCM10029963_58270 [Micromonospora andamanensis]